MIDKAFLVVSNTYSGIIEVLYLTDDLEDALQKRNNIIHSLAVKESKFVEENVDEIIEDIQNDFCIQEWDGESFKCVCKENGIDIITPDLFFYSGDDGNS